MDATAHAETKYLNLEDTILIEEDESDLDFDLGVEDVSGEIQLARQSKNQDFHKIFPTIPSNVFLVEDFNCSWIRDIPIQGKLYLSTEFICFYSNVFGRTIRKVIPLNDLEEIRKETTIGLFPNGIGVKTTNSWYFFSTFYSRDETFNLIYRLHFGYKTKLDGEVTQVQNFALELNTVDDSYYGLPFLGPRTHSPTDNNYVEQEGDNFICDETIQAPLGVVYELLFGKDTKHIIKILKDQKNYDITEATIVGISDEQKSRAYSYTKPLSNPVGPKKTSCNIEETLQINDLELMVLVEQITRTPDVPSGNAFLVKTRIFLSWGDHNFTRFFVVTNIEWSSKSWFKNPIEKGSVNGQKDSMKDLVVTCGKILNGYKSRLLRSQKLDDSPEEKVDSESETASLAGETRELSIYQHLIKIYQILGIQIPFISDELGCLLMVIVFYFALNMTMGRVFASLRWILAPKRINGIGRIQINGNWYKIVNERI